MGREGGGGGVNLKVFIEHDVVTDEDSKGKCVVMVSIPCSR